MKLSVITINYNNLAGLQKTAQSVISQVYDDFEYIIVDGGSTDGSSELLISLQENALMRGLVCKYVSETDRGIYHAMNKGIAMASGDYLHFLNSGDWLLSNDVYKSIFSDLTEDVPILYGNMLKVLANGRRVLDKEVLNLSFHTFYRGSLNQPVYFHSKELFQKYCVFDESFRIVADWKWYFQVVLVEKTPLTYKNVDVALFDMNGISSINKSLDAMERSRYLSEILPTFAIEAFENRLESIEMLDRLKKYRLIYAFIGILERVLFKYERFSTKLRFIFYHKKLLKIKN